MVNVSKKPVEELLKASGVDLSDGGDLEELQQFQKYLPDYKIIVYDGLSPDKLILVEIPFPINNCNI
jgi:hypothetical protein